MSVEHATFVLERDYPVPRARVFAAWAEPDLKRRWFAEDAERWELDFREGGREHSSGEFEAGRYEFDATYQDIVRDERIVYTYTMHMDGERISVSLASVELTAAGDGTHLKLTEHGAYLDGRDTPDMRQSGTGSLLDALGEVLGG